MSGRAERASACVLAFDTATPQVAAAVLADGVVVAEAISDRLMKHGEQLAPLIDQVLVESGRARADITSIAVGAGPGPFTGLRVGLVTARTLGLVLGVPVYGVCTLDVLAAESGLDGPFVVATDARRKEVYLARYESGRRVEGPLVDKPAVLATSLPVVGEGAVLYPDAFPNAVGPLRPSAAWLARVVADGSVEVLEPEPLYLRRPDAVASP